MFRSLAPLALIGLVAACSNGNPINFGGEVEVEPPPPPTELGEEVPIDGVEVPAVVAGHLRTAKYDPGAATIKIDLRTLDGTPLEATYSRAAGLDIAGYDAYTVQETRSQRKFLALFRESGAVQAGVVADGGQFVNHFGGATFTRLQPMTLPSPSGPTNTLLATYSGAYVGLLNTGTTLPHPGDPFDPQQSARVSGEIMLNADFNLENMSVNGGVRNRTIAETGAELPDIFFEATDINSQGGFSGIVKLDPTKAIGNYAGVFGGAGASDVAGATMLRPLPDDSELIEYGAFAMPVCKAGDPAPCP